MDKEPIADDPPQIRIFVPFSLSGRGEAGIVGQRRLSPDLENKAPGGV